jgi:hypothetical protein
VRVEGDAVDDGGDEAGVGEHGSPFAERQICRDRDGGSFLAFGDDLEQQLGAAGVELDIAELVQQEQVEAAVAESPSRTTGSPASIQAPPARAARVAAMPGMWSGL